VTVDGLSAGAYAAEDPAFQGQTIRAGLGNIKKAVK